MAIENENTEDIDLVTFGCRLNTYESAVMRSHAEAAGLKDAIIFNTCAVTKEAERQARQAIRKARRDHPEKKIIVTGCAAQIDPKGFGAMKEVDRVIGNDLKLKAETWFEDSEDKIQVNDIMSVKETASHLVDGFEGRARAFLQIQNGCNHRCTFCIIPYGRGNSRSVPIGEIYRQVQNVLEQGYKEVVFTGVDVTDYGLDLPGTPTLGQMIRRVLALVPELPRLRLSSLDPVEIDDDLWDLIANEPRLMPHLHISLQAGDDMVLKRMKRRHLRHDIVNMVERARELRPDMVFGADIIAGFPTETDEMFENTRRIIEECDIIHNHIFPFSPRPGTPAARMPQVNRDVVKERAATLRETGARQLEAFQKREIGQTRQILIEKDGSGHTEHFLRVKGLQGEAGDLVTQKITETLLH
jgi:threonylcarbamoyladenosine tRNA methylthiotransferase MtaB